jgi:superfamily I DNA/RNA helicase
MQIQQERNLAYVAYTRAMDTLTFAEEGSISTEELVDMYDSGSDED